MLENYPDVLTTQELCTVLRISKKTAYQLLQNGDLDHRRIGRHYRISKESVIAYISTKK